MHDPGRRLLSLTVAAVLMAGGVAGLIASNATTASRIGTLVPATVSLICLRSALRRRRRPRGDASLDPLCGPLAGEQAPTAVVLALRPRSHASRSQVPR